MEADGRGDFKEGVMSQVRHGGLVKYDEDRAWGQGYW